jgi:hypothetical protein
MLAADVSCNYGEDGGEVTKSRLPTRHRQTPRFAIILVSGEWFPELKSRLNLTWTRLVSKVTLSFARCDLRLA